MNRRHFLFQLGAMLGASALPSLVRAESASANMRVGGGWRMQERDWQVGILQVDWSAGKVLLKNAVNTPTQPHAIVPEPGGGFLAVATRPGTWILRVDDEGKQVRRLDAEDEGGRRTFDGHVIASLDGQWLYTGETDRKTGAGWVSVRDVRDLHKVAEFSAHGIDPHQILVDARGRLVVANGGIPRTATGAKRNLEQMDPVLVLMDSGSGGKLGEWRLRDKRLSPHHIAWNQPLDGTPALLGVGLQAEHDDVASRRKAPLLAVWDGNALNVPSYDMLNGYAGDVAAGPNGGFVLTAQHADRIVLWQPEKPGVLMSIGEVQNPCGLWPVIGSDGIVQGVAAGGGLGLARWQPTGGGGMMRWPPGMAAGNHWAILT